MTPPSAATATARRAAAHPARPRPRRAPSAPRRVSGPAGGRRPARGGAIAAPRPLVMRLAAAVHTVAEHRFLDRVIRGRVWIAVLGAGLIGIVFMQVSMLRMNAGIGRAVEQASTLERQNAALQASISQLSSGDRIQAAAEKLGFVLPAAGSVRFLDARDVDFAKAARGIEPPGSHPPQPPASAPSTGMTIGETGVAPSSMPTEEPTTTATATTTTEAPPANPAQTATTPVAAEPATVPPQPAAQAPAQQQQQQPAAAPATVGGTTAGQGG